MALQLSDPLVILIMANLAVTVGCLYLLIENHNVLKKRR